MSRSSSDCSFGSCGASNGAKMAQTTMDAITISAEETGLVRPQLGHRRPQGADHVVGPPAQEVLLAGRRRPIRAPSDITASLILRVERPYRMSIPMLTKTTSTAMTKHDRLEEEEVLVADRLVGEEPEPGQAKTVSTTTVYPASARINSQPSSVSTGMNSVAQAHGRRRMRQLGIPFALAAWTYACSSSSIIDERTTIASRPTAGKARVSRREDQVVDASLPGRGSSQWSSP